jgi:hypothetical protein
MPSALTKKLLLKPGYRALIVNPPEGFVSLLDELPEGVVVDLDQPAGDAYDFVQVFVKDQAELAALGLAAVHAVQFDGVLWICYPKLSGKIKSDLTRDVLWQLVPGMRPVTQVAVDETWSAMRFRPAELVGK